MLDYMDVLLSLLSIIGLCVVSYGLMSAYISNEKYPIACKVIYIPEKKTSIKEAAMRTQKVSEFTKDQGDIKKYDYLYKV